MKKLKTQKKIQSLDKIKSGYGYRFIALWLVGQILFFIKPVFDSIRYSFSEVELTTGKVKTTFNGLNHYKEIFISNPLYADNLRDAVLDMVTLLPIIISLSLIMAIILNQKFHGRLAFRGIFFLPVIIASGVIMYVLKSEYLSVPLFGVANGNEYEYGGMINYNEILSGLALPSQVLKLFTQFLSNVFGLIWSCGVQIILFLSGLQGIPEQLYEVSRIEGTTKWEEFWYVTIPMLKDVILLVLVYTMITIFTSVDNPVIAQAYSTMRDSQIYDQSSAMLWAYFVIVGVIMAAVLFLYNRFCLRKWGGE